MALHPLHEKEQIRAIEIELATARDYIQDDLRNYISRIIEPYDKVGLDDSIFEFAELVGYRINNNRLDIAEDLDVKSRYGIEKNKNLEPLISMAFRGHHNEDFKPEYQFNGLFGKITNDMIEGIRNEIVCRNRMLSLSDEERSELSRSGGLIGGRKVADMINPETGVGYLVEARRKSIEARGAFSWRDNLEYVLEIGELKYEKGLTWKETTTVMNEKYDKDWATATVRMAYQSNKDLLPDEEE
mgnify:FL=1